MSVERWSGFAADLRLEVRQQDGGWSARLWAAGEVVALADSQLTAELAVREVCGFADFAALKALAAVEGWPGSAPSIDGGTLGADGGVPGS